MRVLPAGRPKATAGLAEQCGSGAIADITASVATRSAAPTEAESVGLAAAGVAGRKDGGCTDEGNWWPGGPSVADRGWGPGILSPHVPRMGRSRGGIGALPEIVIDFPQDGASCP